MLCLTLSRRFMLSHSVTPVYALSHSVTQVNALSHSVTQGRPMDVSTESHNCLSLFHQWVGIDHCTADTKKCMPGLAQLA
jgi:hypothetical protein